MRRAAEALALGLALAAAAAGAGCNGQDEAPVSAVRTTDKPAGPVVLTPAASTAPASGAIVDRDVDFHRKRLHLRTAGPEDGPPVLLLHGQKFDSSTWESLGTLAVLAQNGMRAIAIDVPGYGKSEAIELQPDTFLEELIPALGISRPVIVAPSMGGTFALPFVVAHPDAVAGFVPIAPAGLETWLPKLQGCSVPTLIVWGSEDTVIPVAEADQLAGALKNSRKLILQGAPHPAYLERPKEFHEALVKFVAGVAAAH